MSGITVFQKKSIYSPNYRGTLAMLGTQATQRAVFRNVMLATDFSAAARSAIPYAAGLAESFGANLYVMHVHEPANYSLPPEMWQAVQATHDMETQSLRDEVKQEFTDI